MTSISGFLANSYSYLSPKSGQRSAVGAKSDGSAAPAGQATEQTPAKSTATHGTLAGAALTARAKIDAGYAKLGSADTARMTADDWDTVGFPEFDRQMLYAIQTNEGGLFSNAEVKAAKDEVASRISDIVQSSGPDGDWTEVHRKMIEFYDAASDAEKETFAWAEARASHQTAYMLSGGTEDVRTDNPVVNKLTQAWDQVIGSNGTAHDLPNMPAYREALMWWSDANGGARHVDLSA
ncbi:hypothetical protein [Thalassospira sp. UBA1131]|uniref:hypothetical protein n=1 Tax=Thalassospira sp. UBA1131 TaxID=1947672 RepID=UPI0025FABEFA|nr:hypothetical protein [Thalassospira sp. UBA1131]